MAAEGLSMHSVTAARGGCWLGCLQAGVTCWSAIIFEGPERRDGQGLLQLSGLVVGVERL